MTYQLMSMTLRKVGSIIPKEHISTTKNMNKNKKWELKAPIFLFFDSHNRFYVKHHTKRGV